jgi:hypothetical protein
MEKAVKYAQKTSPKFWAQELESNLAATERTKPEVCSLHIEDFVTDSAGKFGQETSPNFGRRSLSQILRR